MYEDYRHHPSRTLGEGVPPFFPLEPVQISKKKVEGKCGVAEVFQDNGGAGPPFLFEKKYLQPPDLK